MNNHYHIFLRTPHADLSSGMHDLNAPYVMMFNRRHERVGPLFQGRYRSILVERGLHYWELSRYIHLNPVRAGLVKDPEKYRWSSCRYFFRCRGRPSWLAWEEVLIKHGKTVQKARKIYREFLREGIESPPESPIRLKKNPAILGTHEFVEHMKKLLDGTLPDEEVPAAKTLFRDISIETVVAEVCREYGVTRDQVRMRGIKDNEARSVAIFLGRELTRLPISELGYFFGGVKGAAISNMTAKMRARQKVDAEFRARLEFVANSIKNVK
jgi:REP element-mobilizing transposase RayT